MRCAIQVMRNGRLLLIIDREGPLPWDLTIDGFCLHLYALSDASGEPIRLEVADETTPVVLLEAIQRLRA